jgi:predicted transcriptional regulator
VSPIPVRPDLYVVARILDVLSKDRRPMRKTRLQMAAGLNYSVFQGYLALQEGRGLVLRVTDPAGNEAFELSARGNEALNFLRQGMTRVLGGVTDQIP